jgi:hypothetical protein
MITKGAFRGVALLASILSIVACDARPGRQSSQGEAVETSTSHPATPVKTGFAEADGARIAYQVYGDLKSDKTPLVVLHG